MSSHLPTHVIQKVAAEADCDPRSVKAYLEHREMRPRVADRITRSLVDRGMASFVRAPVSIDHSPKSRA